MNTLMNCIGITGIVVALIGGLTGVLINNETLIAMSLIVGVGIVCLGFLSIVVIAIYRIQKGNKEVRTP